MSSIEQQLMRDIAAVTEGVVVTDSDLREARNDIGELIDSRRRRDRRRTVAAVAAAVVLVAGGVTAFLTLGDDDGGAPRPAGRPTPAVDPDADWLTGAVPTDALIQGVWRLDNGGLTLQFQPDGTARIDGHGTLFSHPDTVGTYTISDDRITVNVTDDGNPECVGTQFAMRASIVAPGTMNFVQADSGPGGCALLPAGFARGAWDQVLPTRNAQLAGFDNSGSHGWHPLSGKADLYGLFLAGGGGHLLEIDRDGSYYVAAGAITPIDQGHWSLRGSDLTLTSSAGSVGCSKGDTLVLRNVEEVNPGTNVFRGTVGKNTCGGAWTPAEWIMIPSSG